MLDVAAAPPPRNEGESGAGGGAGASAGAGATGDGSAGASASAEAGAGAATHAPVAVHGAALAKLTLGALGVVYGDIGTSPLYALRECVTPPHGVAPTAANILGLMSLILWSLILVISIKYLRFVMRADNQGEGGVLALMALVARRAKPRGPRRTVALVYLGLFGAALLYGDGMITPAISVLSAVEGLEVATKAFTPVVVPVTCAILVLLFAVQKRGTGGIGAVFGPLTLCWFISLAATGLPWVIRRPEIIMAINPLHAVSFFARNRGHGFLVLGSVVLCITGGEALYADMGHFGRPAIRLAWYTVVLPGLLINYFGQGALLLEHPAVQNPFYALVPSFWLYPMVGLATIATVVASQALISGAFSLTRQAVQLGYAPRLTIVHTSGKAEGQIFIPEVNTLLMVACVALVIGFRASGNLADAYGIAVTGTMAMTSILFYFVARDRWQWGPWHAGALLALFLVFDLGFLGACAAKILHGGWFPLAVAAAAFAIMTTWKRGRAILAQRISSATLPLDLFVADVNVCCPPRVKGTAVFLTSVRRGTPNVLLHHFKHNKVLHQQVIIVCIATDAVPEVPQSQRIKMKQFDYGFWAVTAHYGFMETPDMQDLMRQCVAAGLSIDLADTSYYVGRETLLLTRGAELATWRKRLFRILSRNARSATDFFSIPPNRVVEIGTQVEL